jgi:hypothetical protein
MTTFVVFYPSVDFLLANLTLEADVGPFDGVIWESDFTSTANIEVCGPVVSGSDAEHGPKSLTWHLADVPVFTADQDPQAGPDGYAVLK